MAEIRDGTMKDVLVKLRLLSNEIGEINRRFGTSIVLVVATKVTLQI